jgi:WD40 repeat protein
LITFFRKSALHFKFYIQTSSFAINLLFHKLKSDDLTFLSTIINEKIEMKKIDFGDDLQYLQAPSSSSSAEQISDIFLLPGYNYQSISSIDDISILGINRIARDSSHTNRLILGVLGTAEITNYWKDRSALFADIDYPDIFNDKLWDLWLKKIIRPKYLLQKLTQSDGSIPKVFNQLVLDDLLRKADDCWTPLSYLPSTTTTTTTTTTTSATSISSSTHQDDVSVAPTPATAAVTPTTTTPNTATTTKLSRGDSLHPSILFAMITNTYENLTCMHISSSVKQIVTGYQDSIVRVWRVDQHNNNNNSSSQTSSLDALPWFGRNLPDPYTWEMDEIPPHQLRETASYTRKRSFSIYETKTTVSSASPYPCLQLVGHTLPVYSVSQSTCERMILSSSADETIRLWDTAVIQCVGKYACLSIPWHIQFSPIDYYFAAGNSDRTVTVYTTDQETPLRLMTGHTSDVNVVQWHGNGMLIASGSDDMTVRLWDLRTAECVRLLKYATSPITSLAISYVGNTIAAGTEHGKIFYWDLRSTQPLAVFEGHNKPVYSLAFSQDIQHTLISGSADCSLKIWDVTTALDTLYNPANHPTQLMIDPTIPIMTPQCTFYTKACPVYTVGYTNRGMVFAGGAFSTAAASSKYTLKETALIFF